MNRFGVVGLVLVVTGAVLAVGFWPLASLSGAELLAAQSGTDYVGYEPGQRALIREMVIDVGYTPWLDRTFFDLNDGDPDVDTAVIIVGNATGRASIGGYYYFSAVLRSYNFFGFTGEYWEVATPADISPSMPVDAAFYGVIGLGVLFLIASAVRRTPATPRA